MDLKYKYHWNLFYTSLQVISFDLYWHRENMTSQSKSLHLCTSDSPMRLKLHHLNVITFVLRTLTQ